MSVKNTIEECVDRTVYSSKYSAVKKNGPPKFKSVPIHSRGFQTWSTVLSHTSIESPLPNREKPSFDWHENLILWKSRKSSHASNMAYVRKTGPTHTRIGVGLHSAVHRSLRKMNNSSFKSSDNKLQSYNVTRRHGIDRT